MAKKCSAGDLRNRIKFEERTLTPDSIGGSTESWAVFYECWAEIKPANASQVWQARQISHRITHKIKIRYTTGIKADMRINFGGRIMQIKKVINVDERNTWLDIEANEGDAS